MPRLLLLGLLTIGLAVTALSAQQAVLQLPPLVHVRLAGPKGMQVTIYRGSLKGETFDTPCIVGLRPGYRYRVALSNIPDFPQVVFFPTLEVYGSVLLPPSLHAVDFPIGMMFSRDDFQKASAHATVKKVAILERPDTALALASSANEPIELQVPATKDPLEDAVLRGQPLVIMYMGERTFEPSELAIPQGTILFPGEKVLMPPSVPPPLACACYPVLDPVAGAPCPEDMVCLPDGGDIGGRAGIDAMGRIRGVDPTDTVAAYTDSRGKRQLAVSNRVALCVPRYLITRGEIMLAGEVGRAATGDVRGAIGFARASTIVALVETTQNRALLSIGSQTRASGTESIRGTNVVGRIDGLKVTANASGTGTVDGMCLPPLAEPLDGPLRIIKFPDRLGAMIGDIITFTLKFTNTGGRPITDVVVTDSLGARYEYVAGTSRADRAVNFTLHPNDGGSSQLTWDVPGSLLPHETGTITFQVRIR